MSRTPAAEEHAEGRGRHAGDVDRHLDRAIGFEHVERGVTFAGVGPQTSIEASREVLEQFADVVGQVRGFVRRE